MLMHSMFTFNTFIKLMHSPLIALFMISISIISYAYLDQGIGVFLINHNIQTHWFWLEYVTKFGLGFIYLFLFFIAGLWFRFYNKNPLWEIRSWFLLLSIAIPSMIDIVIKIVCSRARPLMWIDHKQYGFYWMKLN